MSPDRKHRSQGRGDDLHGNAPDQSSVVLLLIDVINDLSFPDNKDVARRSAGLAKSIAKLKKHARRQVSRQFTSTTTGADGGLIFPP
jgi:hypothetical protein